MALKKISKSTMWLIAALILIVGAVLIVSVVFANQSKTNAKTFQECLDAGGLLLESYPEQCTIDGKSFTNEEQVSGENNQPYLGLAEEEALAKAASENKVARVVVRDDESLPVTMDFSPGRLNFHVANGTVYLVQVEGE